MPETPGAQRPAGALLVPRESSLDDLGDGREEVRHRGFYVVQALRADAVKGQVRAHVGKPPSVGSEPWEPFGQVRREAGKGLCRRRDQVNGPVGEDSEPLEPDGKRLLPA